MIRHRSIPFYLCPDSRRATSFEKQPPMEQEPGASSSRSPSTGGNGSHLTDRTVRARRIRVFMRQQMNLVNEARCFSCISRVQRVVNSINKIREYLSTDSGAVFEAIAEYIEQELRKVGLTRGYTDDVLEAAISIELKFFCKLISIIQFIDEGQYQSAHRDIKALAGVLMTTGLPAHMAPLYQVYKNCFHFLTQRMVARPC